MRRHDAENVSNTENASNIMDESDKVEIKK